MSPEQWQHKCLNWQSINRGVTKDSPFKVVRITENPGRVVRCVNGNYYVQEGNQVKSVDQETIRELRVKDWSHSTKVEEGEGSEIDKTKK